MYWLLTLEVSLRNTISFPKEKGGAKTGPRFVFFPLISSPKLLGRSGPAARTHWPLLLAVAPLVQAGPPSSPCLSPPLPLPPLLASRGKGAGASAAAGASLLFKIVCAALVHRSIAPTVSRLLSAGAALAYISPAHTALPPVGVKQQVQQLHLLFPGQQCPTWRSPMRWVMAARCLVQWMWPLTPLYNCSWSVPRCASSAPRRSPSPSSPSTLVSSAASASTRGSRGVHRASTTVDEGNRRPRDTERLLRLLAGLNTSRSAILWMSKWAADWISFPADMDWTKNASFSNVTQWMSNSAAPCRRTNATLCKNKSVQLHYSINSSQKWVELRTKN